MKTKIADVTLSPEELEQALIYALKAIAKIQGYGKAPTIKRLKEIFTAYSAYLDFGGDAELKEKVIFWWTSRIGRIETERLAKEKAQKEYLEQLKINALSKLTDQEKRILGLTK